jgi:uncharacterized protein (UPF0264 family)
VLISPSNEQEALEAIAGGADIIDVKNPKEGALGASFPWVIRRIREITPSDRAVSCTLGDLPNLPGSASLAAYGAVALGVNYVKVSLYGLKTSEDAVVLLKAVVKAAKTNCDVKVVARVCRSHDRFTAPSEVPKVASEAGCDVAMIDTAVKDGKNLFDFMTPEQLTRFVSESHSYHLEAALAGSLQKEHLPALCRLDADLVGLRGAACADGDRLKGHITRQKVHELVEIVRNAKTQCAPKA